MEPVVGSFVFHIVRIIKTISKGVVLIISPFLKKLYCRSSYLLYNQDKHCGFVFHKLRLRLVRGDSNRSGLSELVISWVTLDVSFAWIHRQAFCGNSTSIAKYFPLSGYRPAKAGRYPFCHADTGTFLLAAFVATFSCYDSVISIPERFARFCTSCRVSFISIHALGGWRKSRGISGVT